MDVPRRLLVLVVLLAGCAGAGASGKSAGAGPEGWDVTLPTVPKGMLSPIVDGGLVLNSYRGTERIVVTLLYTSEERERIVATYDEWVADRRGVKSGRGFDVEGRVVWSDMWTAPGAEARMTDCLNEASGEFDNLCVALTTWVGSVP